MENNLCLYTFHHDKEIINKKYSVEGVHSLNSEKYTIHMDVFHKSTSAAAAAYNRAIFEYRARS